jgi:recombination protein RecR
MEIPSKYLQDAVEQLASLPGIGKKTALRLALYLLRQNDESAKRFGEAFVELKQKVRFCKRCHNVCDDDLCGICTSNKRQHDIVCVVEDLKDLLAIENTSQYFGAYHILGGNISPMDGIGPSDLTIANLISRIETGTVSEIILALSTTMEGDTTNFYLFKKLSAHPVKITTIARGVAIGDELEYTDQVTLGRSIINRTPFETTLNR